MSWQYYINMEPMALEIVDYHLKKMTDKNLDKREPCYLDVKQFIPNLKNGFVVVTMLVTYSESFINSLVRLEFRKEAEALYGKSTKEKLKLLYKKKGLDNKYQAICADEAFKRYSTVELIRNEMIHYKVSTKEHASGLADFKICKVNASSFFTKAYLSAGKEAAIKIAKLIAKDLGYGIKEDIDIVSCDGNDPVYFNYIYDLKWLDWLGKTY